MNVYSELLDLLRPPAPQVSSGLIGTVRAISPLTLEVRGMDISENLLCPAGMTFYPEDVGREAALLPWEGGLIFLFFIQGGST